jgi:hypothetical protein
MLDAAGKLLLQRDCFGRLDLRQEVGAKTGDHDVP